MRVVVIWRMVILIESLGVDRWLALLAAHRHAPTEPLMVLDCGSAITLDLLVVGGRHLGGYIVPGLALMRSSLLSETAGVAVEALSSVTSCPGRDTSTAVGHGLPLMAAVGLDFLIELGGSCQSLALPVVW